MNENVDGNKELSKVTPKTHPQINFNNLA